MGVRPEFVSFDAEGLPVEIVKVSDAGRYRIVETKIQDAVIKLLLDEGGEIPGSSAKLRFDPRHTQLYADGWIVE